MEKGREKITFDFFYVAVLSVGYLGNDIWLLMHYKKGRELECSSFKYEDAAFKCFERSFIFFLSFIVAC